MIGAAEVGLLFARAIQRQADIDRERRAFLAAMPRVSIYWGRSLHLHMDRLLSVAWAKRADPPEGEYAYSRVVDISWDWLPRLDWRFDPDDSTAWTGRAWRLIRWRWHFRFNVVVIND